MKYVQKFLDCYPEVYFRGQSRDYPTMLPSIAREVGHLENEHNFFSSACDLYPSSFSSSRTFVEKLATMQHYDVPTRLIDVTVDPVIALFFAVQSNDDAAGYVFLYVREGLKIDDERVKVLSLLATLPDKSIETISDAYTHENGESIERDKLLSIVCAPQFLAYSESLCNYNERIKAQKGSFLICGNRIEGDQITNELISLDSIEPALVMRIPPEFKQQIRKALDDRGIKVTYIFPELPTVANYLKSKYRKAVPYIVSDDDYSVFLEEKEAHPTRRRINIQIIIKRPIDILNIKQIVRHVVNKYSHEINIAWVYVASSEADIVAYNWIVRCMWINERWNGPAPKPLSERDSDGFSWATSDSYSVNSDYNEKNLFQDGSSLFITYHALFADLFTLFEQLEKCAIADDMEGFYHLHDKNEIYIDDVLDSVDTSYVNTAAQSAMQRIWMAAMNESVRFA